MVILVWHFFKSIKINAILPTAKDSDKTQTNKPEWQTIFLKHFLKEPVFLKHIFETKTLPRFPLVLSDHADVV